MTTYRTTILILILLRGSMAWADEPTPRALGAQIPSYKATASAEEIVAEPTGTLTLADAHALALMHSPELRSFAWEIRTSEARRRQSGVFPNPELGLDVENGPGTGELKGFDAAEQTLQVSQLFELGGKRPKRLRAAQHELTIVQWDYEAVRLDVLTQVSQAFYAVLAAQERSTLADDDIRLAEDVLATAKKRVETGIAPVDEEMKARLAVSLSRIEKERAVRELASAKIRLAATWGSQQPTFSEVKDGFDTLIIVPAYEQLVIHLPDNPDVARWNTELKRRGSVLDLEKSGRVPDLTLSAGVRRFNENGDVAMVMGASLPLPLFDTNQGNIQAAHSDLVKGHLEQKVAEVKATTDLAEAYRELSSAHNEAAKLKEEILPEAQRVFEAAGGKYRQGKSSYLEVLDAQRTVFEVRRQYVDALESYHRARAQVERLIGAELANVNATPDHK